ncbi:MAG: 50S ribosomal protein L22 [Candidatus Midichloria sp.]|uniref:Large ribosomal subunit protein uL22c n=1 Tax=Hyalomma marginatum TaxID=34627 RepID=A0A8S4C1P6_9ACAR|nr:50S ribosomal protein L22 [Candidatus Midichloria sp.]CAG7590094.1 50S ribosomal protein L22 [Hyalomma marginatum]CAG7591409.1 50S ribosomal protein L22 [Hyalomma marginatum]
MKKDIIELKKEASAKATAVKASVQKLKLVADIIREMNVAEALLQLQFCKRKVAQDIKAVLHSAIANAENNDGMDIDKLYVSTIHLGKSFALKRFHPRGRGRAASIKKPFSNITICVSERG